VADEKMSLAEGFARIDELWQPHVAARVNDYDVKLARVQGEFVWHQHDDTDELFLVMKGRLHILLEGRASEGEVVLEPGDLYVVPAGVRHKPIAEEETHLLLLEPAGTLNTGDAATVGTPGVPLR